MSYKKSSNFSKLPCPMRGIWSVGRNYTYTKQLEDQLLDIFEELDVKAVPDTLEQKLKLARLVAIFKSMLFRSNTRQHRRRRQRKDTYSAPELHISTTAAFPTLRSTGQVPERHLLCERSKTLPSARRFSNRTLRSTQQAPNANSC